MVGTNAGTGYPITFRCSMCRRGRYVHSFMTIGKDALNVVRTGRTRPIPKGQRSGWRSTVVSQQHEYRCLDCGHVGWTKNPDVLMVSVSKNKRGYIDTEYRRGGA